MQQRGIGAVLAPKFTAFASRTRSYPLRVRKLVAIGETNKKKTQNARTRRSWLARLFPAFCACHAEPKLIRTSPMQDRSQDSWSAGYGRPLLGLLLNAIGWAVSMVFAAVLSIACSLGSVVLWVLGLWGIGQWWMNEIASRRRGRRPRQRDWVVAEKIVGTRNRGNLRDGERQFRVDLLLKETTGLDVEDVWLHIKHNSELARANVDE